MSEKRILVVEDEPVTAMDLQERLTGLGYRVVGVASTADQAVDQATRKEPDLVLMDIVLDQGSDGIEAAQCIYDRLAIPVVYLTAHTDPEILDRARRTGPLGYVVKPFRERDLLASIEMALYRGEMDQQIRQGRMRLEQAMRATLGAIDRMVQLKDPLINGHHRRIAELAVAIARDLGLPEDQADGIAQAARVHDVGLLGVPFDILSKPRPLTDAELGVLKGHTRIGYDLFKDIDFPWPIADIALHHHEYLDGSGYPDGLSGDQISIACRVVTVANLVEEAVYGPISSADLPDPPGLETALEYLSEGRGSRFDPAVIDACARLFREGRFGFGS